jgi:hypothetical protein
MGEFLYKELKLSSTDIVEVELDQQANVLLVDYSNFQNYKNRKTFSYIGTHATESPVRLSPPSSGTWYVIIDLGGASGLIKYNVSIIHQG